MRDLHHRVLDAADALAETVHHADYVRTTLEILSDLVPADISFWTSTAFAQHEVTTLGAPVVEPYHDRMVRFGPTHPGVVSYLVDPTDLTPRRVSDVCTALTWRNSAIYSEMSRPLRAHHQLNIITALRPPLDGVGWTATRSSTDFSAQDLTLARALQPLLRVAERRHAPTAPGALAATAHSATPRERQVLALLAQGLTAAAIARRCGVSSRTIRKHLESLYAKLGCSDRLQAVTRARQRGWLPPW